MEVTKSSGNSELAQEGQVGMGRGTAKPLVRNLNEESLPEVEDTMIIKRIIIVVYLALISLGILTGFFLSRRGISIGTTSKTNESTGGKQTTGISDTATFRDSAIGTIEKGGVDGEGTHKLVRDGGPSQTVYLISSVVDLDTFLGKKVKVWGETQAAEKAAWLMDVGKIEISE